MKDDSQVLDTSAWTGAGVEGPGERAVSFTAKPSLLEAIDQDILDEHDPRALAKAALAYVNQYLNAETSAIALREGERLEVAGATGPHLRRLIKSKFHIEGVLAQLLKGQPGAINVPDLTLGLAGNPDNDITGKLIELNARSLLMVAVGEAGLIVLADPEVDAFTSFDEAAVTGVAVQLKYILSRISRERELDGSGDKLRSLLNVIGRIQATNDPTLAMRTTVAEIVERTESDSGSFLLLDEETGNLVLSAAVGMGRGTERIEIKRGEGIAGWVAEHKKPLSVSDLDDVAATGNGMGRRISSAISLPVASGDDLIGVLNLGAQESHHDFILDDLDHLISALARVGAGMAAEDRKSQWRALYFDTIRALARVIESRNPFRLGHSAEVAKAATKLAETIGLKPEEIETIELAAILHDVGVAAFADNVLGQERPLNSGERLILRSHPLLSRNALAEIEYLRGVLPIILHHHENFDGTGYVAGLAGDQIPVGARILAVAEAYVAMTNVRPHRAAKSHEQALAELRERSGTQFDPDIIDTFCEPGSAKKERARKKPRAKSD